MITGAQADGGVRLWATDVPDGAMAPPGWAQQIEGPVVVVSASLRQPAGPDAALRGRFDVLLRSPKHRWLFQDYVPGVDPLEDAWRSREE